jgi:hypothetical protein
MDTAATTASDALLDLVVDFDPEPCTMRSCIECLMSLATGEVSMAPATPGCELCSTRPPNASESSGLEAYEALLAENPMSLKAPLSHIMQHIDGEP